MPDIQPAPPPTPEKPKRTPPTRPIPTDRIAFTKQLDLLRAWAAASGPTSKPASLKDVAQIVKLSDSTSSLANAFFSAMGFLQKTADGFIPSTDVFNYNRAYGWNKETAALKLAPAISTSWFAQALMPRLGFREMPEDEAIDVLAEVSTAAPDYKNQLRTLIDYMEVSGLITREGGILRARAQTASSPEPASPPTETAAEPQVSREMPRAAISTMFSQAAEGAVQFHVSVKVDMAEFAGWKPERIAAFFAGIAQVLAAKGALEKGTAD
ncbi:MAG TPA: hypothetical protein VII75_01080 [Thermoanaerobaculia bacterium]|nr:hypothetical protein [Thermoanaerobaculia bacterium]